MMFSSGALGARAMFQYQGSSFVQLVEEIFADDSDRCLVENSLSTGEPHRVLVVHDRLHIVNAAFACDYTALGESSPDARHPHRRLVCGICRSKGCIAVLRNRYWRG